MMTQLTAGQKVKVNSARGQIVRTVLADLGDIVVIGCDEDVEAVMTNGIGPFSIGFPRCDIVLDGMVLLKHNDQYEQAEHGHARPDRQGIGGGKQSP